MDLVFSCFIIAAFISSCASDDSPTCLENQQRSHYFDRHKYYVCYFGKWVTQFCFYGWEYDIITQQCQEPIRVPGSYSPQGIPKGSPFGDFSIGAQKPQVGFEPVLKTPLRYSPWWCSCCAPPSPCPFGQYFPDNCNCRKFYQCDHGGAVHKDCAPGTAFNPLLNVCDWPYKVPLCRYLGQE